MSDPCLPDDSRWRIIQVLEAVGSSCIAQCDCGTIRKLNTYSVVSGHSKSCGCLAADDLTVRNTSHGQCGRISRSPEYIAWVNMKDRCYNPSNKRYKMYNDNGIRVCSRWFNSFNAFFTDMGERPSENHSLDRIDNNKSYCKSNCRWATPIEQVRNRRNTVYITYNKVRRPLAEWAEILNLNYATLYTRLFVYRHSLRRAFNDTKI